MPLLRDCLKIEFYTTSEAFSEYKNALLNLKTIKMVQKSTFFALYEMIKIVFRQFLRLIFDKNARFFKN